MPRALQEADPLKPTGDHLPFDSLLPAGQIAQPLQTKEAQIRQIERPSGDLCCRERTLAIVVFAIRLDVRVNQRQLTIRWGVAEPEVVVQHVPQEPPRPEYVIPRELDQRIKTMSELIQALAANVDASDRERQQQLSILKLELAAMRRQSQERMSETERDLSALYAAHFGSRPKAVNP